MDRRRLKHLPDLSWKPAGQRFLDSGLVAGTTVLEVTTPSMASCSGFSVLLSSTMTLMSLPAVSFIMMVWTGELVMPAVRFSFGLVDSCTVTGVVDGFGVLVVGTLVGLEPGFIVKSL